MKQQYRLTDDTQFQRVRNQGKSWAHPLLVLVAAPNNLEITRCGFSVGKRMGKAHSRNRIKRMLREAVRVRHAGIKPGYDLVWIARTALTDKADFWDVDITVETLLRRAHLLNFIPPQALNRPRKGEEGSKVALSESRDRPD
jgi:ribonuclease P protein component